HGLCLTEILGDLADDHFALCFRLGCPYHVDLPVKIINQDINKINLTINIVWRAAGNVNPGLDSWLSQEREGSACSGAGYVFLRRGGRCGCAGSTWTTKNGRLWRHPATVW